MRPVLPLLLCALSASPAFAGPSKAQAAAGAQLFSSSGCAHCHGEKLQGTDVGPDLRGVGRRLKPADISRQIHDGGKEMPAFGDVLTGDQIDQLVAFLRTQKAKSPKPHKPRS